MKFVYHFKTPDNVRHTGEIEAKDRETAFAELRARGIRAIKIETTDGERTRGNGAWKWWTGGTVLTLILGAALGFALAGGSRPAILRAHDISDDLHFITLVKRADALRKEHRAVLGKLKLEWARNYALIENIKDVSPITKQIEHGQEAVKYSRLRTTDLFKDLLSLFPESHSRERQFAQKLYGELMDELDLDEYNLSCAYMAVSLLSENRGKWHEEKGRVVWDDETLKHEFEPYATDSDAATARWRRDFSNAAIESNVISVPQKE